MDINNKNRKVKSAKKIYEKNKKSNLNIKNNKNKNIKKIISQSINHSSNKKAVDKIRNIAKNIDKRKRLFSANINSKNKIKTDFETEYNRLEILCDKKIKRDKKDIEKYMIERKIKYKEDKEQKKTNKLNYFKKMFKNYQKLEKEIKKINQASKNEEKKQKEIKKLDINLNEKSNGSLENNKFNDNYYFGCLDVKRILKNIGLKNKK